MFNEQFYSWFYTTVYGVAAGIGFGSVLYQLGGHELAAQVAIPLLLAVVAHQIIWQSSHTGGAE